MSNVLGDNKQQQVLALGRLGWSLRRIEEATTVRRETASAYLKAAGIPVRERGGRPKEWPPKPATVTEVSTDPCPAKPATTREVSTDPGSPWYKCPFSAAQSGSHGPMCGRERKHVIGSSVEYGGDVSRDSPPYGQDRGD